LPSAVAMPRRSTAPVESWNDGARVLALPCDVTIRENVDALVREVGEQLGPIDVLINNAGIISVGPVETMEVEDFQQAMATNF
jgi:NAD(P)-dependent dehydrogenase (short-subunit alcohol dehydrogenase family)